MPPKNTAPSATPVSATKVFNFLINVLITAVVRNKAGIEERRSIDAVFQLDEVAAEKPWFVLRNFLVPQYLNQKLGAFGSGWVKIYEIKILKLVNRKNPNDVEGIPLRVMSFEQMELYCKKWEYPIKPRIFHSPEVARQYIALFEEDPAGYDIQYRKYIDGLAHKHPEMNDIRRNTENYIGESDDLAKELASLGETKGPEVAQEMVQPALEDYIPGPQPAPAAEATPAVGKKKKKVKTPAETPSAEEAIANPAADPFAGV